MRSCLVGATVGILLCLQGAAEARTGPHFDEGMRLLKQFEYAEARDPETLLPLEGLSDRATILVAARVGPARLIDNITLEGGDS